MKAIVSAVALLFLSVSLSFAQTQQYDYVIKALGQSIGTASMQLRQAGENRYIFNKTIMEANLLLKRIRMEVDNTTHYRAGKLFHSYVQVMVNGDLHSSATIQWNGEAYTMQQDQDPIKTLVFPIPYSGSLLYFQEPKDIQEAFSESSGLFMPILSHEPGMYQITDPNNNRKMEYFYEDGLLKEFFIRHPLLKISFELEGAEMGGQ